MKNHNSGMFLTWCGWIFYKFLFDSFSKGLLGLTASQNSFGTDFLGTTLFVPHEASIKRGI